MDKTYMRLFATLARAMELNAERAMEENHKNADLKGETTAQTMRDGYRQLKEKLEDDNAVLTKADYSQLLIGCTVIVAQLEGKIKNEQAVLQSYKTGTMPHLKRIIECATDEEAQTLANQLFTVEQKSNT